MRDATGDPPVRLLADAGITACHTLKRGVTGLGSENVAVIVGCGGLGHLGIQMLRAMSDCTIVAVDPKEEARDLAKSVGVDYVAGDDVADVLTEASRGEAERAFADLEAGNVRGRAVLVP